MEKHKRIPKLSYSDTKRIDPIDHWQKVLRTAGLPQISYDAATAALIKLGAIPERIPGAGDE